MTMIDDEILNSILRRFGILEAEATKLDIGIVHQSFHIRALKGNAKNIAQNAPGPINGMPHRPPTQAEYILQKINHFSVETNDNIVKITEVLKQNGHETFDLMRALETDTAYIIDDNNVIWRLLSKIQGFTLNCCPNPTLSESAARLLADFHNLFAKQTITLAPLPFQFHNFSLYYRELELALTKRNHRFHANVIKLKSAIDQALSPLKPMIETLPTLRKRIVHQDLKFNNVMLRQENPAASEAKAVALIDFDTVNYNPLYIDLGDAWRHWCNPHGEDGPRVEFDLAIFEASAQAYFSTLDIPLQQDEKQSIHLAPEIIALELCIRFSTDIINEHYFGWHRTKFQSAAEHNLLRAENQLALVHELMRTRSKRLKYLNRLF